VQQGVTEGGNMHAPKVLPGRHTTQDGDGERVGRRSTSFFQADSNSLRVDPVCCAVTDLQARPQHDTTLQDSCAASGEQKVNLGRATCA
jgi:hypothetical protein